MEHEKVECACGKTIYQAAPGEWVHAVTNKVDCYVAAIYAGFFARPKEA